MPSKRLLIVIGIVTVLIGIASRLPATIVMDRIQVPGVEFNGVRGTIWEGGIDNLVYNNEPVAPVAWKLHPSALLRGAAKADFTFLPQQSRIEGTIEAGMGAEITLTNLSLDGDLRYIASGTSLGPVRGAVAGLIDEAIVVNSWPQHVAGNLQVTDLRYPANAPYSLGNFSLTCAPSDPPVICDIVDRGGPLVVEGTLTLRDQRQYELKGQVRARPDAPNEIRNGLRFVGPADARGNVSVEFAGQL